MSSRQTILHCTNLHKTFAAESPLHVLRGVDLDVHRGEIVFILGVSGSGKSTLLHLLGGLDRPDDGNVLWMDHDIFSLSDEALATLRNTTIGFVFQFHHLLPEFSALENVIIPQMIGGKSFADAEVRARELLVKVGVAHRETHRPGELSGGEQQRVAVARALANNPSIIMADEPTGNLDSENSRQLHDLVLELNKTEGQTFIIVTHNEQFVSDSSRVLWMADGKLQ